MLLTAGAVADLDDLTATRGLPDDARERVKGRLRQLEDHPLSGVALGGGRWAPARVLVGPWTWMLVVYDYDPEVDTVTVLSVEDSRTSTAPR